MYPGSLHGVNIGPICQMLRRAGGAEDSEESGLGEKIGAARKKGQT